MSNLWYFKDQDREQGPLGFFFLQLLAREGKIGPETFVRPEDGSWVPARSVADLFDPAAPAPAPAPARPSAPPVSPESPGGAGFGGKAAGWLVAVLIFGLLRVMFAAFQHPPNVSPPSARFPAFDLDRIQQKQHEMEKMQEVMKKIQELQRMQNDPEGPLERLLRQAREKQEQEREEKFVGPPAPAQP